MCVKVSVLCKGALPLSSHFEICLHKGSVLCISQRVSLQFSMRGGDTLTLSVVDEVVTSVGGVVLVGLDVLLWVQVTGPSGVYVINMLIETVGIARVSLTSSNHERQSAALLQVPDIIQMLLYRW